MSPEKFSPTLLQDWTILVVDDEVDSLLVAQRILKHYGATVITAANGEEGLEMAKSHLPRFIISDLSMPKLDGWGLAVALQADETTAVIPLIALTAHAMVGDQERAFEVGFKGYVTKPLLPAHFISEVVAIISDIPELAAALGD